MKSMFLVIGLVEKSKVILFPKCQVVIPPLDIWRGNKDLMNGFPRITSFLRFFYQKKVGFNPKTLVFYYCSGQLIIFNFDPLVLLNFSEVFSKNFVGIKPSRMQFESTLVSKRAIVSRTKSLIIVLILIQNFWILILSLHEFDLSHVTVTLSLTLTHFLIYFFIWLLTLTNKLLVKIHVFKPCQHLICFQCKNAKLFCSMFMLIN